MSGGEWMVVLIVLTVVIGKLVSRAMGYPGRGSPRRAGREDRSGVLRDEVARLKERLAVLERIVTDDARRLDAEIEALRGPGDRPLPAPHATDMGSARVSADVREG